MVTCFLLSSQRANGNNVIRCNNWGSSLSSDLCELVRVRSLHWRQHMCLYHVLFEFKIFIEKYFKTYHPSIFVVVISLCEDRHFIQQHI